MAIQTLKPHRSTLHGTFFRDWEPVLTIAPGDGVELETLDVRWSIEDPRQDGTLGRRFAPRDDERDNDHALCGPIFIRGAEPGMVLTVAIGKLVPGT